MFISGGAFEGVVGDIVSPFGYKRGEGIDAGFGELDWICDRDRERTDPLFEALNPIDGKISGSGQLQFLRTKNLVLSCLILLYFSC